MLTGNLCVFKKSTTVFWGQTEVANKISEAMLRLKMLKPHFLHITEIGEIAEKGGMYIDYENRIVYVNPNNGLFIFTHLSSLSYIIKSAWLYLLSFQRVSAWRILVLLGLLPLADN